MIPPAVVNQIKRLLAEGAYSQRKIARMIGVSRGTVGAIARGKRPDYAASPNQQENELQAPAGPPARCPNCGGFVYLPCRLCHVRTLLAENLIAKPPANSEGRLQVELSGSPRARYERIRQRRLQARLPGG
jgi:transcriptional regulator with XRE-family HTH domain